MRDILAFLMLYLLCNLITLIVLLQGNTNPMSVFIYGQFFGIFGSYFISIFFREGLFT